MGGLPENLKIPTHKFGGTKCNVICLPCMVHSTLNTTCRVEQCMHLTALTNYSFATAAAATAGPANDNDNAAIKCFVAFMEYIEGNTTNPRSTINQSSSKRVQLKLTTAFSINSQRIPFKYKNTNNYI